MRCPYPLYFSTALRMHTKHCLLRTHVRVHSLTWRAVPARPYYARSCLLQDYYSSTLVSTTLACPVVWSSVTVGTSQLLLVRTIFKITPLISGISHIYFLSLPYRSIGNLSHGKAIFISPLQQDRGVVLLFLLDGSILAKVYQREGQAEQRDK